MTEFYFIRHGRTQANDDGIKQGTTNNASTYLTPRGKAQVRSLAVSFDIHFATAIYTSPLVRAITSADILNRAAKKRIILDDRLKEITYGSWDGQKAVDLQAKYPQCFDSHLLEALPNYTNVATDGETFAQVEQRVASFIHDTATSDPAGKFIVVTHGFTIKAAVLSILHPQDPMTIPEPANATVTKISVENGHPYLWYYNRITPN